VQSLTDVKALRLMAATAEGEGEIEIWDPAWGRRIRGALYMKLAVRTKEIKGAFKGVSKYRTS
jgi:hypothetical protein